MNTAQIKAIALNLSPEVRAHGLEVIAATIARYYPVQRSKVRRALGLKTPMKIALWNKS